LWTFENRVLEGVVVLKREDGDVYIIISATICIISDVLFTDALTTLPSANFALRPYTWSNSGTAERI
jgi:hypothetical protein